jgi:manganese/iron transport system substrate-binding protein
LEIDRDRAFASAALATAFSTQEPHLHQVYPIIPAMQIRTNRPRFKLFRRQAILLSTILLISGLSGCQTPKTRQPDTTVNTSTSPSPTTKANKNPKVVVTTTVLCDLTRQIAASTIDLVCLLTPGSDAHIYKLTPAARQSIEQAQLILYGGYNFEPELIKAIKATSNLAPKIAVHEVGVPQPQQFEEDGRSTIDPHVWHNAKNGAKIATVIETNLAKLVPTQATTYQHNTSKLTAEIGQIDTWIRSQINTIPANQKTIFTTHDSLGYYATAYGIPVNALEGLSTEEKPNAARARELVDKIRKTQVPTIYAETSLNQQLIKTVAQAANVKVADREIYADGLGEANSAGGTYQQMLIANTRSIVVGLGGKYTPFIGK